MQIGLLLLLALAPLLAGLGAADCEFHMEVRAVATSQETWLRQQSDPRAWLMPSLQGEPRFIKPPLTVWLHMLAWTGLPPDAPVETLILRARYTALAAALLALLATFAAGATLGGSQLGFAAAAVLGSSLLFIRQMRLASYDTYLLAFSALAIAAGIRAAQEPRNTRAWLGAGLALGAAILVKGPLAILLVIAPLVAIAFRSWRGLLLMLATATALAAPWYLFILLHIPEASRRFALEFEAARETGSPFWYYFGLFGLVFPWCVWLIAGCWNGLRGQPAYRKALVWFVALFVLLSIPDAKQQRYIVPILPAASLLAALAFLQSTSARLIKLHAGLLVALSLGFGLFGAGQPWLLAHGYLKRPELAALPAWLFAATTPALLALAFACLRARRETALWLTAGWMSLAATPAFFAYAHSYHDRYPYKEEVTRVAALTRDAPFYFLKGPFTAPQYEHPDPKFTLYSRRALPGVTLEQARELAAPAWLTAPVNDEANAELLKSGWIPVLDYRDQKPLRRLYRRGG